MHPSITDHMSTTRMDQYQREAMVMQRVNHAKSNSDNPMGSSSLTRNLWYVFFGLNILPQAKNRAKHILYPAFKHV